MNNLAQNKFREAGNQQFKNENYDEAIIQYTNGITQLEESGKTDDVLKALLLSNRAACHLCLRKYEDALRDAQLSLSCNLTPKAYLRKGRALAALNSKSAEAQECFEKAVEMEPSNSAYKEELERFKKADFTAAGSTNPYAIAIFYLDLATILSAVVHIITIFFAPGIAVLLWKLALVTFGARQFIALKINNQIPAINTSFFNNLTSGFNGQYLVLIGLLLIGSCPPIHLIMIAMSIYCLFDLLDGFKTKLDAAIDQLPGMIRGLIAPRIEQSTSPESRQYLIVNAVACEVMSSIFCLIVGGGFFMMIAILQFVKWRYQTDNFVKRVFNSMHVSILQLTAHRYCPTAVRPLYEKVAGWIHAYADRQ